MTPLHRFEGIERQYKNITVIDCKFGISKSEMVFCTLLWIMLPVE